MPAMLETIASGFGTVLAAEHGLLDTLHGLLAAENGCHDRGIARILTHQIGQLGAIIALLTKREMQLPHSTRFGVSNHHLVLLTHEANALPCGEKQPLANLVNRNQNLRRSLEVFIEQSDWQDETCLQEAADRHGEMEWVLTVLLKEPVSARPTCGTTDGNRENEGGAR